MARAVLFGGPARGPRGMDRVDAVQPTAGQGRVLVHPNRVSVPSQQRRNPGQTLVDVVNFHDQLLDLRPIVARDAFQYLQLTFLDVNLQQIDLLDPVLTQDRRKRTDRALNRFLMQALGQQLIDRRLGRRCSVRGLGQ